MKMYKKIKNFLFLSLASLLIFSSLFSFNKTNTHAASSYEGIVTAYSLNVRDTPSTKEKF